MCAKAVNSPQTAAALHLVGKNDFLSTRCGKVTILMDGLEVIVTNGVTVIFAVL